MVAHSGGGDRYAVLYHEFADGQMALLFIGLLIWMLPYDKWFLLGIAAGALAGGAIGIAQFRTFMSEYREITGDDAD